MVRMPSIAAPSVTCPIAYPCIVTVQWGSQYITILHWFLPGFSLIHTYPMSIWQSLLPISPPELLTRHSNVGLRLPYFSIMCRIANIESAIPLPGMKPNSASVSLLSIIPSQIFKSISALSLCNPHNPGCLTPLYQVVQSDYLSTPLIYSPARIHFASD